MSTVRKSETSGERLRRMCKNIANDINNKKLGEAGNIDEFMEHVYTCREPGFGVLETL